MRVIVATKSGTLPLLPVEIKENLFSLLPSKLCISVPYAQTHYLIQNLSGTNLNFNTFLRQQENVELVITPFTLHKSFIDSYKQINGSTISLQSPFNRRVKIKCSTFVDNVEKVVEPSFYLGMTQVYKSRAQNIDQQKASALKMSRKNLWLLKEQLTIAKKSIFAPIVVIKDNFLCDSTTGRVYSIENDELVFTETVRSQTEEIDFNKNSISGCWVISDSFFPDDNKLSVDIDKFLNLVHKFIHSLTKKHQNLKTVFSIREENVNLSFSIFQRSCDKFDFIETILPEQLVEKKQFISFNPDKKLKNNEDNNQNQYIDSVTDIFIGSEEALVRDCPCFACKHYNRSYIKHLLDRHEILGQALLYVHNLHQIIQCSNEIGIDQL